MSSTAFSGGYLSCPHCENEFKTKKSLNAHLENPPKYCEKFRRNDKMNFVSQESGSSNQNKSNEYLGDGLLQRYMKEARKEVEGLSSIMLFHLDQDLDVYTLQEMIGQCRVRIRSIDSTVLDDSKIINDKIIDYQSKYGTRAEETEFLNNSNSCHLLELSKLRELYMLKIGVIDVLMIKQQPDYICLTQLEKMFGRDLISKLSIEYGTK